MDRNIFVTIILIVTFLIVGVLNIAAEEQYVMIGDSVSIVTNNSNKTVEVKTKKTLYKKGKEYPIYIMASNGRCYVKRISAKNNREYKIYLPETISKQIAEELGYQYTYKKNK